MAARHFRHSSTFVCSICGHRTRETTQPVGSHLCGLCDELAMQQNSLWDNGADYYRQHGIAYRDELMARVAKRGGDQAAIRRHLADLFSI